MSSRTEDPQAFRRIDVSLSSERLVRQGSIAIPELVLGATPEPVSR